MTPTEIAALEQWISLAIEPRPEPANTRGVTRWFLSPLGGWTGDPEDGEYQARPWTTDETANAMLRHALLDAGFHLTFIKQSTGQMMLWINSSEHYLADTDLIAVCLAFKAFKESK